MHRELMQRVKVKEKNPIEISTINLSKEIDQHTE
jgi:hypothetical protein